MNSSDRMPMSVRAMVVGAALIAGVPIGFTAFSDASDQLWPWARLPAHVVVHVRNDSVGVVSVRYDRATRRFQHGPLGTAAVASGEAAHDTFCLVPTEHQLSGVIQLGSSAASSVVPFSCAITPDEHLRFTIDPQGQVTLARGRESWVGYTRFGRPVVVSRGAP
jgi:hypothetical protein